MSLKNQSWNKSFFGAGSGYGDNWDPTKNPISIGFIPGYALQSRELLELQTILAYQTSTSNRCLFKHGQPRIDLETENIENVNTSPVTKTPAEALNGGKLLVYKNAEFFTNFTTPPNVESWIPTGFWITFPPYTNSGTDDFLAIPIPGDAADYIGFELEIKVVTGDGSETDQFGNVYDFRDPAGNEFNNSQAFGAGRLVYEIVNQTTDGGAPTVYKQSANRNPMLTRGPNSLIGFVPIIKKQAADTYVFAYDENITVPIDTIDA
jgi:hypothetical protein